MLGGGPASQHRSLGHGQREDGRSAGQVEEGDRARGLVVGRGAGGGVEERRGCEARGGAVKCRGVGRGGGGAGGRG